MTFLVPAFLVLGVVTALVVSLGWWGHAHRRRRLGAFLGGRRATRRLTSADLHRLRIERLLLLGLSSFAVGAAAAGPRSATGPGLAPVRSVVLAVDVSASMQAVDASPTRLARAVEVAEQLIDGLPENPIGLLLFAGESYPLAPPTRDHAALRYFLSGVTPTTASEHDPGSLWSAGIADAAALWTTPVEPGEERTIVLIGDGEVGEPEAQVLDAVRSAMVRGIRVSAVGVGTLTGSGVVIPPAPYQVGGPVLDQNGVPVTSRMAAAALGRMVAAGQGVYASGEDARALAKLRDTLAPEDVAAPWWVRYDLGLLLILIALAGLVLESLLDVRLPVLRAGVRRRVA
jgi:Ca-activated chloride channel family protein